MTQIQFNNIIQQLLNNNGKIHRFTEPVQNLEALVKGCNRKGYYRPDPSKSLPVFNDEIFWVLEKYYKVSVKNPTEVFAVLRIV